MKDEFRIKIPRWEDVKEATVAITPSVYARLEQLSEATGVKLRYLVEQCIEFALERLDGGESEDAETNTGDYNTEDCNTGGWNAGNRNTGNCNTGDYNTEDCNTGSWNTGNCNTGYYNTGNCNTEDCNTGSWNTGNCNTGYYNTGNYNTGYYNTGNCNTGNCNTGNCNTGDCNTGDWNIISYATGCFNTEQHNMLFFDKPAPVTMEQWRKSKACKILNNMNLSPVKWVKFDDMTNVEKAVHLEASTTGGYLKTSDVAESNQAQWDELDDYNKFAIKQIPNFDTDKFREITGIVVD